MQRIFSSPKFIGTFGPILPDDEMGRKQTEKLIEFKDSEGFFRNTTVGGSITGEALDIGVIDDPIKGRAEASSLLVRDKTWGWLTDDFLPRFADNAAMLLIMTRWHLDDPAGRLMEHYPGVRVLRYPAIAEENEKNRREGRAVIPGAQVARFPREAARCDVACWLAIGVSTVAHRCRWWHVSNRED